MKIQPTSLAARAQSKVAQAFTLIEMLIVVTIIGIIVGIGVPALRDARDNARTAKQDSVLANVAAAKARFLLEPTSTTAAFNALSEEQKWDAIRVYLNVRGAVPPTGAAGEQLLTQGTGFTGVTVNNADAAPALN